MCSSGEWFLHHDNAPAHTALSVQQFLAKNNMTVIPYPPCSPDLAPCDFSLFPRMKGQIKATSSADVSEVKKKTLDFLNNISNEEFQKCFRQREKRCYKCIESKGEYFEGDWSCNGISTKKTLKKKSGYFWVPLVYITRRQNFKFRMKQRSWKFLCNNQQMHD